ncbi:hypothetical protein [uncultured Draconibacterium sp.]|uniref:hypothetical protein n=1 Tax=uncultured Draconibacterium sp. TaxID=1573823 RepID=UPI002AA71F65|nr:hypothetical protein [uncultured Draconibacterium sp.]
MNDYSLNNDVLQELFGLASNQTLLLTLLIMVSINIGVEIFRFVSKWALSNKSKKDKRLILIEEKRIKILEQLFQSLDSLTLYDNSQDQELLAKLKDINKFMTRNKIYIPKEFQKHTNNILDYFKNILTDYRNRDYEKETKLFNKYCNAFNK